MTAASPAYIPQPPATVLVASPNAHTRRAVLERLRDSCPIEQAHGGAEALAKLEACGARLMLLDRHLPDLDCNELVTLVESRHPNVEVILMEDESGSVKIPPELRDDPAYRLCCKLDSATPPQPEKGPEPKLPVEAPQQLELLEEWLPGMIGNSAPMLEVYRLVKLVAARTATVLITGETGTGKELIAEALHRLSSRSEKPFVTVNCAAIPESLLEAELFGYARGAFTGAVQSRVGKVHAAQGGTIFFDEIGDMPLNLQAKLLRFLESGEVQRLGAPDVFRVDTRVIAATNVDLEERVARGEFREDLYYRLTVFPIELPPLRARGEDVLLLARHFVRESCEGATTLSPSAEPLLMRHDWPGNVRELRHVMERACILAEAQRQIKAEHVIVKTLPRARRY